MQRDGPKSSPASSQQRAKPIEQAVNRGELWPSGAVSGAAPLSRSSGNSELAPSAAAGKERSSICNAASVSAVSQAAFGALSIPTRSGQRLLLKCGDEATAGQGVDAAAGCASRSSSMCPWDELAAVRTVPGHIPGGTR